MSKVYTERYQYLLQRLIQARERVRLTQDDVAKQLNKPQSYISKIESGERRLDFIELEDLCHIYNVPLQFFGTLRKEVNPNRTE